MKTCDCGGMLYRHGTVRNKSTGASSRYICKVCGHSITVRDGVIVKGRGPRVNDWRTETTQEKRA